MLRAVLQRAVESHPGGILEKHLQTLLARVNEGQTLHEGLAQTGDYFPPLFRQFVALGEETGQLPEVLSRLADHYDHQLLLRRDFLSAITWPLIQLFAAIALVGFLIWFLGVLQSILNVEVFDITGLGLVGTRGLVIYLAFWIVLFVSGWLLFESAKRGLSGTYWLHRGILWVPVLGSAIRTLVLSRMAWAMELIFDTELDLKKSIPLILGSTGNLVYQGQAQELVREVSEGHPLSEALSRAGDYPRDFLDTLEVGEQTGRIPESMALLASQYQDKARRALAILTQIAGFLVWALVAALIVVVIFRLFWVAYLGPIYQELNNF